MKSNPTYPVRLSFTQIKQLVLQLPEKDKIKISKELEKDGIHSRLTRLLNKFKTYKLTEEEILLECNNVREEHYIQSHGK
jgi:hypothetical protein